MAEIQIDGVGPVQVSDGFLRLPPDQQAAEVDEFMAKFKPPNAPLPEPPMEGVPQPTVARAAAAPAEGSAVGRIASRAGEVASDRFGDRQIGLSEQTLQELRDKGILKPPGAPVTPIYALNEIFYNYGAKAADLALRAIAGGIGALQGAGGQTAQELGASPGMARRLERDIGMGVESAGVVAGGGPAVPRLAAAERGATAERAAAETTPGRQSVTVAAPGGAAEFKEAARPFYRQAEEAGVVIKPESYQGLATDIFQSASKGGLDPTLTPNSTAAVKRIAELADPKVGPVSFETLDRMRQIASDARASAKASDRRVASGIVEKIDDYIGKLSSKDVLAGDAKVAADTIVKARDLWSRAAKLERIETIIDRAQTTAGQFSGSGFENALRTEFRALAKNKSEMRTFTADEQKAIKLVARGDRGGNLARGVGRLAARGPVSAFTSGGIGASIGSAVLGPGLGTAIGAGTAFGIGEIGRKVATVLTQRAIARLQETIRNGGDSATARSSISRANNLIAALQGQAIPAAVGSISQEQRR